ncbi:MAG: energy transducer TonB [Desulfobacteraceae bacterium]
MGISLTGSRTNRKADIKNMTPLICGMKSPWIKSGVTALCMTLLLFSLMPVLLEPVGKKALEEPAVQVNVIRVPRPDTPVRRKNPAPPKQKPKKIKIVPRAAAMKMAKPKLSLPFDINPRLAAGPSNFEIPPMAQAVTGDFDLPNVFDAGDLDQPLITLTRIPPVYPMRAKQQKIQGHVRVQFIVNTHGTVDNVTVIESKPPGVFDQSVINCVSGWRFEPGTIEGEPVNTWAETTISFELEQDE